MSGKTAILGGGISGLSAAYYLISNPAFRAVKVIEASNRTGGWVRSRISSCGSLFEEGPRTIKPLTPAGKNTLDLIDSLNLTEKVNPISVVQPVARNRMIYAGKKLHKLPNTFLGLFRGNALFKKPVVSFLFTDIRAPRLEKEDESLYSFTERRLGKTAADYIMSPVICGICAGDAKQISVKFVTKTLFEYEQKYGSIVRGFLASSLEEIRDRSKKVQEIRQSSNNKSQSGLPEKPDQERISTYKWAEKEKWAIWNLEGGLEQIPTALAAEIKSQGVEIDLNTKCEEITFAEDGVRLKMNGRTEEYSRVISSLPAKNLASLVQHQHPQLAEELKAIPMVTVVVVNLEFAGNILEEEAFGLLVPPCEKLPILGVTYDSCISPGNDSTVFTVMMGGAWFQSNFGDRPTEEHLLSVAVDQLKSILNIHEDPIAHNVAILRDCIPQYVVGHTQRISRIEKYLAERKLSLSLCGSSYYGVGVNDVILSAKKAASAFDQ